MTERQWLRARTTPREMSEVLEERGIIVERKLLLLLVAFARRIWRFMEHEGSRAGVEYAEREAEEFGCDPKWPDHLHSREPQYAVMEVPPGSSAYWAAKIAEQAWLLVCTAEMVWDISDVSDAVLTALGVEAIGKPLSSIQEMYRVLPIGASSGRYLLPASVRRERMAHCDLLRDIFGNPFRPVVFSTSWRTDTALSLAQQMYESRDFSAMPILADALQDAGCDNEPILNHCRDTNATHVRGCWVVDCVLGRA